MFHFLALCPLVDLLWMKQLLYVKFHIVLNYTSIFFKTTSLVKKHRLSSPSLIVVLFFKRHEWHAPTKVHKRLKDYFLLLHLFPDKFAVSLKAVFRFLCDQKFRTVEQFLIWRENSRTVNHSAAHQHLQHTHGLLAKRYALISNHNFIRVSCTI